MAEFIPPSLPTDVPMSERLVFEALQGLPDDWTVLWNVPVGLFDRPRADLRQIDFLLLNRTFGAMVLEVKGGTIKVDGGKWYTRPRNGSEWHELPRSPFEQAADQRFALYRFVKGSRPIDRSALCHAVIFPGCNVTADLGSDAPREIAIDASDLRDVVASLRRARSHWGQTDGLSGPDIEWLVNRLRPSFEMTVLSSEHSAQTLDILDRETRRTVEMVGDQVDAYRTMLSTGRVAVLGGAGTGKTVIAGALGEQLAQNGTRTLLLCHRPAVRSFLFALLAIRTTNREYDPASESPLHVNSWSRVATAVTQRDSYSAARVRDLDEQFFAFREAMDDPYGALVIDEAQEFTQYQLEALSWLLDDPTADPIYLFADPFQHSGLFSTSLPDRLKGHVTYDWVPPEGFERIVLTTNCRSSRQIVEAAGSLYPGAGARAIVDGPDIAFREVEVKRVLHEAFRTVGRLIVKEKFRANQILVIILGAALADAERHANRRHVMTIRATDLYRFPLTAKDLRVVVGVPSDVQGLEADAVVVAHVESPSRAARDAYIAVSRARSLLHIVSNATQSDFFGLAESFDPTDGRSDG